MKKEEVPSAKALRKQQKRSNEQEFIMSTWECYQEMLLTGKSSKLSQAPPSPLEFKLEKTTRFALNPSTPSDCLRALAQDVGTFTFRDNTLNAKAQLALSSLWRGLVTLSEQIEGGHRSCSRTREVSSSSSEEEDGTIISTKYQKSKAIRKKKAALKKV
ncbi:hypothetical protein FGO68_gene3372 [Halteria grandinella]|uniref:Uncharacterized protein n=1 Tax=Halteria grandinella TaxID=5974 RepID=A0A8J8NS08_HALGN|nr:hypothetical protein FGO68_gene3372 [Halteria grandinella]